MFKTDYELLAHGSSFLIQVPDSQLTLALVSAHVAAPHRFPNYFPHSWLRHVTDHDCRSIFQRLTSTTSETSSILSNTSSTGTAVRTTQPLIRGFRHASLDVAAFILDPQSINLNDVPVLNLHHDKELTEGDAVMIDGFALLDGASGSGTERMVSTQLNGVVSNIRNSRVFVDTGEQLSEMGMCGGPAVLADDHSACVGLLEGLVPALDDDTQDTTSAGDASSSSSSDGSAVQQQNELHKQLENKSVLVSAQELYKFVCDIEKNIHPKSAQG